MAGFADYLRGGSTPAPPSAATSSFAKWLEEDKARKEAEAAKAAEVAAAQELVATPPEGPVSTPYAPTGAMGVLGNMFRGNAVDQARETAPTDTLGSNPLNVLPQAVGSVAANTAGSIGVLADTALNIPRQLAESALPADWYERLYGTKEGVPFSQATMAGADVADALRGSTNDMFPMPEANRQWQAENQAVKQAGGNAFDELITGIRNPIGVLQEAAKMGAEFALPAKALGVMGSTALMEGGGTDQSAIEFEQQWKEGTIQQSAAYQQLASEIGPEAAKEAIKAKRLQLTAQLQALTGVAAAKVSAKLGGQKIEDFLAGNADEGISALQVPVQALFEGAEEVPVQLGGNIAAQWTGDPTREATAGAASAAVQGFLVGGATAGGMSTIQSGSAWANEKLNQFDGVSDGKPKGVKPDQKSASNTGTIKERAIETGSIDTNKERTIEPTTIVSNIEELSSSVNPAEGLASIAQEEAPVNTQTEDQTASVNTATALEASPVVEGKPHLRATERGWEIVPDANASAAPEVPTLVTRSEPSAPLPATTLPAPSQNAPVAPPSPVPVDVSAAPAVPVAAPPVVKVKPAAKPRDFRVQATTELQAKAQTDPVYRARVTSNPTLIQTDILARAKELQDADVAAKAAAKATTPDTTKSMAPTSLDTYAAATGLADKSDNHIRSYVRTGKDAIDAVASGAIDAPEPVREMARRLAAVSDFSDVPVTLSDNAAADGLVRETPEGQFMASGFYSARDNAVKLLSSKGGRNLEVAEVVVHEMAHAGTVRAMAQIESGELKDPELRDLLEDMKVGLAALKDGIKAGTVSGPRADYAASDIFELVATVYGDPRLARKLDEAKITIPRRGARRGRVASVLQIIKDFVAKLFGMTSSQVDQILLSTRVRETVERMSAAKEAREARPTGKAGKGYDRLKKLAPPTTIKQDSLVEQRERGTMGVAGPIVDKMRVLATPRGAGSMTTQLAAEEQAGLEADYRLETELALGDMEAAYKDAVAHLPKATAEVYRPDMLKYMQGDKAVGAKLPTKLRESIDALRTIMDNRTLMMIALGAIPPKQVPKYLNNLGKWTHKDYMKMRMDQASFARMVQDYAHAGKDVIAEVLPEVMADLALPPVENIQQLGDRASTKNKDKDSRKAARAILKKYATQWGIGATTKLDGPDGTVERLKALKQAGEGKLREVAIYYANRIINPKTTSKDTNIANMVGSNLVIDDSAIDKLRVHMPAYMAKLYGEFKDPAAVAVLSLEQQGRILAKFKALLDYREAGINDGIIKKDAAGMDASTMDKQGFTQLESDDPLHYGPLQGYWIKRTDKWLLDAVAGMEAIEFSMNPARYLADYIKSGNRDTLFKKGASVGMGIVAAAQPIGKGFKISQVLLDHTGATVNALSSAVFLSGGLTAPMGSGLSAARAARESSFAGTMFGTNLKQAGTARKAKIAEHVRFLTRATVLQNASLSADLRSDLIDRIDNELDQYLPGAKRVYNKVGRLGRRAVDFAARVNSFGDEFSKVLMWYSRIPHLKAIYPDKTEQEVWALAAEEVLQTTANWHRSAPLARVFSNTGMLNPFMVFQTEMLRTAFNSLALATRYAAKARKGFKTPEGAAAGKYAQMELAHFMIRIAGAAAVNKVMLAGATLAAGVLAGLAGDDDKEGFPKPVVEGNLDLTRRPRVANPDGGTSTVFSMSAEFDGRIFLLPRVSEDGRLMSEKEAVEEFKRTKRHLGIFNTEDTAKKYSDLLHNEQEEMGDSWGVGTDNTPRFVVEAPSVNLKKWEAGSKMNEPKNYVHARELLPSFTLGDVNFLREVEPDVYTFASTQRLEVLPIANIYNAAKRGDWEEMKTIATNFAASETPTWSPFWSMVGNAPAAMFGDERTQGTAQKEIKESTGKLAEAVTPGAVKRLWKQATGPVDLDAVETVLNQTAATVQRLDLKKTAGYNIADYKVAVDKATAALRDDMGDIDGVGEAIVGHGIDYTGAVVTKYRSFVKARRTVLALKGLGKSEDWIRAAIKTNPINDSLSKEEVTSLMTGNFRMPDFGEVLTKKEESMLKAATLESEKVKVKNVFKQYREDLANQRALFAEFIKREKESL